MKKYKIELKWAIIFCAMSLLWVFGERLIGLHDTYIGKHHLYTNLIFIPAILIYVLALREKSKTDYHGYMNYRQGFLSGVVMSVFIALLSPLSQFINAKLISPYYFENAIKYAVVHNKASLEAATNYFELNNYMMQAFVGALIVGIIIGAIVAFFVSSKKLPQAL